MSVRVRAGAQPVAAARVRIPGSPGCDGETDPEGTVDLDGCPSGARQLRVEAPGFARESRPVTLAAGTQSFEVALSPTTPLHGRVQDDHGALLERHLL